MKRKQISMLFTLVMIGLFLTLFTPKIFAQEEAVLKLPVTIMVTGAKPSVHEDYVVVLEADDLAFPMPQGSENGVFELLAKGEGTHLFDDIFYSKLGIYTYRVYLEPGKNFLGTYDKTIYTLRVYLTNAMDGSGYELMVVSHREGQNEKPDELEFMVDYDQVKLPDTGTVNQMVYLASGIGAIGIGSVILLMKKKKE